MFYNNIDFSNNEIAREAFKAALNTNEHLLILGDSHTGKTQLLEVVKDITAKSVITLYPTEKLAIEHEEVGINSFLQTTSNPNQKDAIDDFVGNIDMIIIDNCFQTQACQLDKLDIRLRFLKMNDEAFGGIQLILTGNINEFPIGAKSKFYISNYFFDSFAFKNLSYKAFFLNKYYGLKEWDFITFDIAHFISLNSSEGTASVLNTPYCDIDLKTFNRMFVNSKNENNNLFPVLVLDNLEADEINNTRISELGGNKHYLNSTIEGYFPQNSTSIPKTLELKKGCPIVIGSSTSTNLTKGEIAIFQYADENDMYLSHNNKEIVIQRKVWHNYQYVLSQEKIEKVALGAFIQFPVLPAFAVSLVQSEGLCFENCHLDNSSALPKGIISSAFAKHNKQFSLSYPLRPEEIGKNNDLERFLTTYSQKLTCK